MWSRRTFFERAIGIQVSASELLPWDMWQCVRPSKFQTLGLPNAVGAIIFHIDLERTLQLRFL